MGVRTRGVLCLTNHISSLPLEGCGNERPADSQVCNNGPCENRIEWFTGPWSQVWGWREVLLGLRGRCLEQINVCDFTVTGFVVMCDWIHMVCALLCAAQCSAECGAGSQQRSVVCLMKADEGFTIMPPYECSSLDRPLSQQSCNLKACGAKWYHTDWSAVSKIWNPRPICPLHAIKQGILPLWPSLTDIMDNHTNSSSASKFMSWIFFFKEIMLKLLLKSWQLAESFSCTPNTFLIF